MHPRDSQPDDQATLPLNGGDDLARSRSRQRDASAVAASPGKNSSSANSDSVVSMGVPNTVAVETNDNKPTSLTTWNGMTIALSVAMAWARGSRLGCG